MIFSNTENNLNSIEEFQKLLWAYRVLPEAKLKRTFMEVSGYPHYENVCSNILGFYFDPTAEHGLNDLLLRAFLQMACKKDMGSLGQVSVIREFCTANGRIDLFVESESFTIGIENKIFHWLANDLTDYAHVLDELGNKNGKKAIVIKAVLSIRPIQNLGTLKGGFVNFTYSQLWHQVQKMLGSHIAKADQKWVTYLIDFMETTTNLAGENMELKQTELFFIEHNRIIEKMIKERNAFQGRLAQKIVELSDLMKETNEVKSLATPPYKYSNDRLVLDFKKFANIYEISFDFFLTPSGWDLQLFGRGGPSFNYLLKLINQPVLHAKMINATSIDNGKRYCVQNWDVRTDLGEIRNELCSWITTIDEASNAVSV